MRLTILNEIGGLLDRKFKRFKKHLWRSSGSHAVGKRIAKHLERGRKRYNDKAYTVAIEEFRHVLTIDPKHQRALYYIANACYKTNDYSQARRYWEQCISADPVSKFADLAHTRLQHLDKQNRRGKSKLEEFYRQVGS